jgi:chemotaxis signal transduction protein
VLKIESGGQLFALPLEAVEGVVELQALAAVPRAPAVVRGLVTFRGEVLIGADLARLHGGGAGIADLRRIVAVAAGGKRVAVLTHKGLTVRLADRAAFKPPDAQAASAVIGVDPRHVALLDPAALIAQIFAAAEARRG